MSSMPLHEVLKRLGERYHRKRHLQLLTRDWQARILILPQDGGEPHALRVANGEVTFAGRADGERVPDGYVEPDVSPERERWDLTLTGRERELALYFSGDPLYHHYAQSVILTGSVRDRLKLEALVRLTACGEAG